MANRKKTMKQDETVKVTYGLNSKEYGDITRMVFPNGTRIYLCTKTGIHLTAPRAMVMKQLSNQKRKDMEIVITNDDIETILFVLKHRELMKLKKAAQKPTKKRKKKC